MSPLIRRVIRPPMSVSNYRAIFITSVLSKLFKSLVKSLGLFMERSGGVLPTTLFAY